MLRGIFSSFVYGREMKLKWTQILQLLIQWLVGIIAANPEALFRIRVILFFLKINLIFLSKAWNKLFFKKKHVRCSFKRKRYEYLFSVYIYSEHFLFWAQSFGSNKVARITIRTVHTKWMKTNLVTY